MSVFVLAQGRIEHPRTVILKFDSKEYFRAWYDSGDYQSILPLRLESTPESLIVVDGIPG